MPTVIIQIGPTYYAAKEDKTAWQTTTVTSGAPDFSSATECLDPSIRNALWRFNQMASVDGTVTYLPA
jgi:hypothetical protein